MDSPTITDDEDELVFPVHIRRNQSRLEPFRRHIAAMRKANWPYAKIADWLAREKGVQVTFQSVAKFCSLRGIVAKSGIEPEGGQAPAQPSDAIAAESKSTRSPKRRKKKKKVFNYEERPLATRFNGRLREKPHD